MMAPKKNDYIITINVLINVKFKTNLFISHYYTQMF